MWIYITQGITLGIYASLLPGPMQAYLMSQALRLGWKRALPLAFAPVLGDAPIIALVLLLVSQLPQGFLNALHFIGGFFLIYLAWMTYKVFQNDDLLNQPPSENVEKQHFLKAAMVNIFNPNVYLFWMTIGAPIALEGWAKSPVYGISFIAVMYVFVVITLGGLVVLFGTARQLKPRIRQVIGILLAVMLLGFGGYQLWSGVTALL
jgi:threonine/homoserine/homoserine lactone efflux protein